MATYVISYTGSKDIKANSKEEAVTKFDKIMKGENWDLYSVYKE